jgi:hypothetical protein
MSKVHIDVKQLMIRSSLTGVPRLCRVRQTIYCHNIAASLPMRYGGYGIRFSADRLLLTLPKTTVTSVASVIVIGQSSTRASAFYFPRLETWMPIFFGLTFSTSIICTGP